MNGLRVTIAARKDLSLFVGRMNCIVAIPVAWLEQMNCSFRLSPLFNWKLQTLRRGLLYVVIIRLA